VGLVQGRLERAVGVLTAAGAPRLVIAELQWEILRRDSSRWPDQRRRAASLREVFHDAGRADEVSAIDAWLVSEPPEDR
jgi:hypothetical protein